VRVDIFYRRLSPRGQAIVNILGVCLFLLPMSIFILAISWDYVSVSWQIRAGSREAGGLPYPFVPALKSVIVMTAILLMLPAIADLTASALVVMGGAPADPPASED